MSKYDVKVLSSPETTGGPSWVVTMENAVSEDEVQRLKIALGVAAGYETSSEMSAEANYEQRINTLQRTDVDQCLVKEDCYRDDLTQNVLQRISNLVGMEEGNSEYLQLLRYEPGQ
jgi:prolyl 4-hydroxylase